jgi:spore coat polysaccharide biosynthesis protein SpsF
LEIQKIKLINPLPHIGIITQARMTSSRLPGKILLEINKKSLLQYHIERLKQTGFEIIIATTENKTDDCICDFSKKFNLNFYRGDEQNVLSRFYGAALSRKFDIIVRVTSDCPLIDPHLIRNSVEKFIKLNNQNLYMSNAIERTFARGFDFEIFTFDALKDAFEDAEEESDLEHVTPYIWKNRSGKYELYHIKQPTNNSDLRITVDTEDDFQLIKILIEKYNADTLSYNEIEDILRSNLELIKINSHIEQKKI